MDNSYQCSFFPGETAAHRRPKWEQLFPKGAEAHAWAHARTHTFLKWLPEESLHWSVEKQREVVAEINLSTTTPCHLLPQWRAWMRNLWLLQRCGGEVPEIKWMGEERCLERSWTWWWSWAWERKNKNIFPVYKCLFLFFCLFVFVVYLFPSSQMSSQTFILACSKLRLPKAYFSHNCGW